MASLTNAQIIETFHVALLDALPARLDLARYVLKGGANLRYFFGSVRYSEDIDFDLNGEESWRLTDKVNAVLDGVVDPLLRASGLSVGDYSYTKQTETTQRWKVGIKVGDDNELVRTKIEFSNRNRETRFSLDRVPTGITNPYGLRAPKVQHYVDDAPTEQKIRALAGRPQSQARDVFDLDLLLRQRPLASGSLDPDLLAEGAERALQQDFDLFQTQVVPFLEPEAVELYGHKEAWEQIQASVAEQLEEAR